MPKQIVSVDVILRDNGFVIAGRPAIGPTTWRRRGVTLTQRQALELIRMEAERTNHKLKQMREAVA